MDTVGARVRRMRLEKRMTVTGLAEKAGCSRSTITKLEAGLREKTIMKYARIAQLLGCRIDDLFPEMDEPKEEKKVSEGKTVCADGFEENELEGWIP